MHSTKALLDLPFELREAIYEYLVVKPANTITMLENHNCFQNEVSAAQPAITRVNRQIRAEALPLFYKSNVFLAELSEKLDLDIAKRWLIAIGNSNVVHLRRLVLCGWSQVIYQGRPSRLWIRCLFDLKDGTLTIDGNHVVVNGKKYISKDMSMMQQAFQFMIEYLDGGAWNELALRYFLEGFHEHCMKCSTKFCMKCSQAKKKGVETPHG